ncbi:MAG: FAD-dependent oxidoreductase [Bacteroidetes bacterium]|nr:FAD-dependent oxidoreductase [Bacteroidota bacterium]
MKQSVIVIGGGISGMTAAGILALQGLDVTLLEKETAIGGHVAHWDRLFPDRKKASEVLDFAMEGLKKVKLVTGVTISGISKHDDGFTVSTSLQDAGCGMQDANTTQLPPAADHDSLFTASAILLATGFDLFEARKKEEYGYGIYNNVITSADLEKNFKSGKAILTHEGKVPGRIGIVHCVGSRDEKVGNLYCSKVCCVTGVKQAIELKELYPASEVFNFYMDLRMFDRHFEELYYEAQQKWGVSFIRGRLSECSENPDGSIILKTEDTLTGSPLKMTVDLLVLLTGFVPAQSAKTICSMLDLKTGSDGFVNPADSHTKNNLSGINGVFLAGAVKGPVSIQEAIADARAAAALLAGYIKSTLVND